MRALAAVLAGLLPVLGNAAEPAAPPPEEMLPVVRTQAAPVAEKLGLPADRAITRLDAEVIERRQAENIFDVLKDVPGVAVVGGPRASGMRFTLRGFTDNEDVLFKIDGAVKGFEKYRFGGGVFLEPELLKTLSVERGPSVTSGSGALGGTISATTKNASDLLAPGQRAGALLKLGFNANNRERLRMGAVFGRVAERIELLAAVVRRDSQDLRLPDGTRLTLSSTHSESRLAKIGFTPVDELFIELGHVAYRAGPERQPYDATGGLVGVGGIVHRDIDDATTHLRFAWEPASRFKLRGMLARERTHLHDLHKRGETRFQICANGPIEYCNDDWHYDIVNGELFADTTLKLGEVDAAVTLGAQGLRNRRDVKRVSSNARLNEMNWPGGFNAAQPPGDKHSHALIAEGRLTWRDWTLTPGMRWDRYTVIAQGGTRDSMAREGQTPEISFAKAQPSLALTWRVPHTALALTGRYNEGFRPPLIDQYFADGSANAAMQSGLCMRTVNDPLRGGVVSASTIRPLYDTAGLGRPYDPALDHAPTNGICGDLYVPQQSANRELTLAWEPAQQGGQQWFGRLTLFRIRTDRLLSSLRWQDGRVQQPGIEQRRGLELELRYGSRLWFGEFNLARVKRRAVHETAAEQSGADSYSVPPDSAGLTLGLRALQGRVEAGWRLRHLADRRAYIAGAPAVCASTADAAGVGTHYGVDTHELFASWQAAPWALLRAGVDNLTNQDYCLSSSFAGGVGFHAPGRAAKLSVTLQY
ncbi:TonB-dependent receptor domain-containing protein [Roseateles sp. LKC17W]|uniref:TonB-dependent receptor domain-containing protein n=1 Tax=Pelomonas margarita TaxID=3299031 RepID=A0ABW7FPK2_9BURK